MEVKLSTRGRYGLKAMFELSLRHNSGPTPIKEIAASQNIPDNYLEQLFYQLKKAGYIISVRGACGGYSLSKEPIEIVVGDIIRLLEGEIAPSECVSSNSNCDRSGCCVTQKVWEKIKESVENVIDKITLQDMVDDYKDKGEIL